MTPLTTSELPLTIQSRLQVYGPTPRKNKSLGVLQSFNRMKQSNWLPPRNIQISSPNCVMFSSKCRKTRSLIKNHVISPVELNSKLTCDCCQSKFQVLYWSTCHPSDQIGWNRRI